MNWRMMVPPTQANYQLLLRVDYYDNCEICDNHGSFNNPDGPETVPAHGFFYICNF